MPADRNELATLDGLQIFVDDAESRELDGKRCSAQKERGEERRSETPIGVVK